MTNDATKRIPRQDLYNRYLEAIKAVGMFQYETNYPWFVPKRLSELARGQTTCSSSALNIPHHLTSALDAATFLIFQQPPQLFLISLTGGKRSEGVINIQLFCEMVRKVFPRILQTTQPSSGFKLVYVGLLVS